LIVTSSYRDEDHNRAVGGVDGSSHCLSSDGLYSGVDLSVANLGSRGLFHVVRNALLVGFIRIGIYGDHVHLDVEERLAQAVLWVGKD
ncbi:MAG TPA: D-Ala-D-Ala carboxypeptidase family metallohydrolase, partial [Candidatus Binatia bacterium]